MKTLIVAGEASGDLHAANLLAELRRLEPAVEAFGVEPLVEQSVLHALGDALFALVEPVEHRLVEERAQNDDQE